MARSPHAVFIFLHQSGAHKTLRSRACQASEDILSVQMPVLLSRSPLAKAARCRVVAESTSADVFVEI